MTGGLRHGQGQKRVNRWGRKTRGEGFNKSGEAGKERRGERGLKNKKDGSA